MNNLTLCLMSIGMGILLIGLGIPMMKEKIRPNRWYGFRTPKTLSDPAIWYPANKSAGFAMLVAGLTMVIASGLLHLFTANVNETFMALVHLALWVAAIGSMTIYSFMELRKILAAGGGSQSGD